jgi:hypothetical protein
MLQLILAEVWEAQAVRPSVQGKLGAAAAAAPQHMLIVLATRGATHSKVGLRVAAVQVEAEAVGLSRLVWAMAVVVGAG